MPAYAVTYTYTDDAEARDALRPDHRAYLASQETLRVSGPYVGGATDGALLIYVADGLEDVHEITLGDPFVTAGLVAEWDVREWNAVLGPVSGQFA